MIINDHVVLRHDPSVPTRLIRGPMTKDAALDHVTKLITVSGIVVAYCRNIRGYHSPNRRQRFRPFFYKPQPNAFKKPL